MSIDIGAVCEYAFASQLLNRGIVPNWPSVESGAYDMVADAGTKLLRVQVKGTQSKGPIIRMCIQRRGVNRANRRYNKDEVDIIAIYLFEFDVWYLIPVEKVMKDIRIKPTDPACRWQRYKNAWKLLER